jgi:hypothetical protein
MLTHERLLEVLDYDPDSGIFTWLAPRSSRVKPGQIAGSIDPRGYRRIGVLGTAYFAHRLAWLACYAKWPDGVIDHIDGNTVNNSIFNLRDVPQVLNTRNFKLSKNNTSGFNGVSWSAKGKTWTAHIMIGGKSIYVGRADSPEKAYALRQLAEQGLDFRVR